MIRVPVGFISEDIPTALPNGPFTLRVSGPSAAWTVNSPDSFAVMRVDTPTNPLSFRAANQIIGDRDQDSTLGNPDHNLTRTKDADVADLNNDGYLDILDANSNNSDNGTDVIIRRNDRNGGFTSVTVGPRDNTVSYDTDLVDLNGDGLADMLRTESPGGAIRRIAIYPNLGEDNGWFDLGAPSYTDNLDLCPDDIAVGDLDRDGRLDLAVTERIGNLCNTDAVQVSNTTVFSGTGDGLSFNRIQQLPAPTLPGDSSTHDVVFLDANADGNLDIFALNEDGTNSSRLWISNGATPLNFTLSTEAFATALTGAAADFNGDGLDDLVAGGTNAVTVYLNSRTTPGTFSSSALSNSAAGSFYDLELGDLDLDGDIDIIGVTIAGSSGEVRIWLNDGDGTFTAFGGTNPLPGHINYQRLSADVIDYDRDGDLDVYVTGGDGQNVGCFGCVPNQLFINQRALNIVHPTAAIQAEVRAEDTDPRVLVRLSGPNLPMPSAGDFQFEVGGDTWGAERIVSIGRVGAEIWMVVRPGQQLVAARTCFDLTVSMVSAPSLTDTEADAICYEPQAPTDRMIAIDRTTSMLRIGDTPDEEKMRSAIAAGTFFVDLSGQNDRLGALSFQFVGDANNNGAVELVPEVVRQEGPSFGPITTTQRMDLLTAINNVTPTPVQPMPETSIGAPAAESLRILEAAATPMTRDIVLITDGLENTPPIYEEAVESDILDASPPVRLHTVSVGADADDELLQRIAERTGGTWVNLLTGEGSFFLLSRLADIYKRIDADIRDEQRFLYREGLPDCTVPFGAACIRIDAIEVPEGLEWMTVAFHWDNPNGTPPDFSGSLQLSGPDNVPVTHAPPTVESYADGRHKTYRIRQPAAGTWTYAVGVPQTDLNPEDVEFFVAASAPSILALRAGPVDITYLEPSGIDAHMRLVLTDNAPVLGASVTAELRNPDGSKVPVTFLDDGLHDDGAAGDGIYGYIHTGTQRGAYLAYAEATGTDNSGNTFTRYALLSFQYRKLNLDPDLPDGLPELPEEGGCRCLPGGEDWSVSLFGGSTIPHGIFDDRAGAGPAFGLLLQRQWTSQLATGIFNGYDRFNNEADDESLFLTHISPQIAVRINEQICPSPSLHGGAGVYIDQNGQSAFGYNVGASLAVCLADRLSASLRYDFRDVPDFDVRYSTALLGLGWTF